MRKKIIYVLIFIFMLGTIAYFYINTVLLPVKLKGFVEQKLSEFLQRKSTIEKIDFDFISGFTVKNLVILKKGNSRDNFIKVEKLNFGVIIAPFFKTKTIIIPTITVNSPVININKISETSFDISDLIEKKSATAAGETKSQFSFIVRQVNINSGLINFNDYSTQNVFTETISNIDLNAAISLAKNINFSFKCDIPRVNGNIYTKGSYETKTKKINAALSLNNIEVAKYLSLYPVTIPFQLKDGVITKADLSLKYQNNTGEVVGSFEGKNIDLSNAAFRFKGDFKLPEINAGLSEGAWEGKTSATFIINNLVFANKSLKGNLSLALPSFSLSKDKININGVITGDTLKFSFNDTLIEADFSGQNLSLVKTKEKTTLDGNLSANNFAYKLADDKQIKGNITLPNLSLESYSDGVYAQGNLSFNNADIILGENKINGNIQSPDTALSFKDNQFSYQGNITIAAARMNLAQGANINGEFLLNDTVFKFKEGNFELISQPQITKSDITLPGNKKIQGEITVKRLSVNSDDNFTKISTELLIKDAVLQIDKDKSFSGYPHLVIDYNINKNNPRNNSYKGSLNLDGASLSGLPYVNLVKNISGTLFFDNDSASTKSLSLTTLDTNLNISGQVNNFLNPSLDIIAAGENISIDKIKEISPEIFKKYNLDLSGRLDANVKYKGSIKTPQNADISLTAFLKGVSYKNISFKTPVTNISGHISYSKDLLTVKNVQSTFAEQNFILNGKISDFANPAVEATISAKNLSIKSSINISNQIAHIKAISGNYINSSFAINGSAHLIKNSSPFLDLGGNFVIDLNDIKYIAPALYNKLSGLNLSGTVNLTDLVLKGPANDWRNWQLSFNAYSNVLKIFGHAFDDVSIFFSQKDKYINKLNLTSYIYDGQFTIASTGDLSNEKIPMNIAINLAGLKLEELRKHIKTSNQNLSGDLSLTFDITGPIMNNEELTGVGKAEIKDGFLGKFLPTYEQTYFKNAYADFTINKGKIITKDGRLISDTIILLVDGYTDFKKNLNYTISPDLSKINLGTNTSLPVNPTTLLSDFMSISISGTIDKPSYSLKPSTKKILQKTGEVLGTTSEVLKEGIGVILDGIFGGQ